MRFSKVLPAAMGSVLAIWAQKPIAVSGLMGNYLDYSTIAASPNGDTYYFAAWAANSMLPLFPNPAGLPVVGSVNDGTSGAGCNSGGGGNINLLQLSKLPGPLTTPTSGNTLITAFPNCFSSFGAVSGAQDAPTGWTGHCTGGDAGYGCTWKGMVLAFRNNILLGAPYRQTSPGDRFGDSTMVLSPDAGQTWIDWSRYNSSAVTGATCNNSTVILTASNTVSVNSNIYVHDVSLAVNGKQTVTARDAATVTYTLKDRFGNTLSCPGASGVGGYFGPLDPAGSAPLYDAASANMMWPVVSGANPMTVASPIVYGQDGNYPAGIEAACDPTAYVCGLSTDDLSPARPVYLYRVPLGQEMNKASYQWYYCPGYSTKFAVAESVCDGNLSGSWTGTIGSATAIMNLQIAGIWPGERYPLTFVPSHGAYLLSGLTRDPAGTRFSYMWAPHPWGPFYPGYMSDCVETGSSGNPAHTCGPGFNTAMAYGYNLISSSPAISQIRISSDEGPGSRPPGGAPSFWALQAETGRAPFTGAARRANYLGALGQQLGMGHRHIAAWRGIFVGLVGGLLGSRRGNRKSQPYLFQGCDQRRCEIRPSQVVGFK
jgi:hypothetical protein